MSKNLRIENKCEPGRNFSYVITATRGKPFKSIITWNTLRQKFEFCDKEEDHEKTNNEVKGLLNYIRNDRELEELKNAGIFLKLTK